MDQYNLAAHGDDFEKSFWSKFIQNEFPSYEEFWGKFIAPLTNRPRDIHFKTDQELSAIGKTAHDICIAQLHYSILRHIARAYVLKETPNFNPDLLAEGMVRLCGAQDIAFELLERFCNPSSYDAWSERDGQSARRQWQEQNDFPLQDVRDYRNHLIHGRMLPAVVRGTLNLPRIGVESKYLDWRIITDPTNNPGLDLNEFMPVRDILIQAWRNTVGYIEDQWKTILLTP